MKKLVLLSAIVLGGVAYNNKANAQISIHLGFNVPVRHVYVPAPEPVETVYNDYYDNSDDYYYLPDVEAYYSVPNHCYYYNDGDNWVSAAYLPGAYRNYDWRNARRFEIRSNRPYMHHDIYRSRWGGNDNGRSWGHRDDNFAGRGFDNRDGEYNHKDGEYNHRDGEYNHRDGEYNHRDGEYNHRDGGAFGQHSNQNYGQPYGGGRNNGYNGRDGWDGQSAGGNGYYQPNQNQGGNGNRNYGGGQPYQNGGGYNRGNNGNSQPANQNSGGNRGNGYTGGQIAQNAMRNNARMDASMRPARF